MAPLHKTSPALSVIGITPLITLVYSVSSWPPSPLHPLEPGKAKGTGYEGPKFKLQRSLCIWNILPSRKLHCDVADKVFPELLWFPSKAGR